MEYEDDPQPPIFSAAYLASQASETAKSVVLAGGYFDRYLTFIQARSRTRYAAETDVRDELRDPGGY